MATRRQLYDDAIAKLRNYVPSSTKEDYIRLILGQGSVDKASNIGNVTEQSRQDPGGVVSAAVTPALDLLNGGKFAHEIMAGLITAMAGEADYKKKRSTISRFVRFTLTKAAKDKVSETDKNNPSVGFVASNKKLWENVDPKDAADIDFFYLDKAFTLPKDDKSGIDYKKYDNFASPSKDNPNISVMEVLNSRIGPGVRDTAGLSIFCSLIPPQTISRAVPYVNVTLIDPGINENDGGKTYSKSLNMIRYLKGRTPAEGVGPTAAMILSLTGSDGGTGPTRGGMELFTSPQTLVSNLDDISATAFSNSTPIDRFRPLMTLKSFSIDVVPAGAGMLNYKKGAIEIALHDRGRLAEVSQLVRPGGYSNLEIEVEYGWSIDPRSSSATVQNRKLTGFALQDDALSQFVDSLRVKEKYQVTNSTFRFEEGGQVNISMNIFMKGSFDLRTYDISLDQSKELSKQLKSLLADLNKSIQQTAGRAESVFGETLLTAVASPESILQISQETIKELQQKVLTALKGNKLSADLASIAGDLSKIIGDGGIIKTSQAQTKSAITNAIDQLAEGEEVFPTTTVLDGKKGSVQAAYKDIIGTNNYKTKYYATSISLGKLVVAFMAVPLASSKKYDEIQLVFGKLNDRAGMMRSLSLAAFPLDKAKITEKLSDLYGKNINVSPAQFMGVLGESFVNYHADPAYGFGDAYDAEGKLNADVSKGQTVVDNALKKAGINDLNFQMPELAFTAECVPHENFPEKTILRLLIFDKSCNPYQTMTEAVNAARNDTASFVDIDGLSAEHPLFATKSWPDISKEYISKDRADLITTMVSRGVLKPAKNVDAVEALKTGKQEYNIDLTKLFVSNDWKSAKKFFMESIPTIRYGASTGMITSLGLSSISSGPLANINIMKSNESGNENEASSREKGVPLTISPTEVQVEMLGCPIVSYGQYVYVDFGTNTSADNIYACVGISHKFEPGNFTTSMKLTGIGTYGVYASSVRSIDLTKAIIDQYVQNPTASDNATTTNPEPKTVTYGWKDVSGGVSVAQLRVSFVAQKTFGNNVKGIRYWFKGKIDTGGPYIDAAGKLQIYFSGDVSDQKYADSESIARDSLMKVDSTVSCVEMQVDGIAKIANNKLQAISYGPGSGVVTVVEIDMTDYNKEIDELDS